MQCSYHYCKRDFEAKRKNSKFCSSRCKNCYFVDKRRKKLKVMSVNYKGGKCAVCGYSKSVGALQFHHRNPSDKLFNISHCHTRSWANIQKELDKCDILCANCHAELEYASLLQFKHKEYNLVVPQGFEP